MMVLVIKILLHKKHVLMSNKNIQVLLFRFLDITTNVPKHQTACDVWSTMKNAEGVVKMQHLQNKITTLLTKSQFRHDKLNLTTCSHIITTF